MEEEYDERRYWTANNGYTRAASLFPCHNHRNQRPFTMKNQHPQCGGGRPAAVPIPPRLQRPGHRSGSRIASHSVRMDITVEHGKASLDNWEVTFQSFRCTNVD
jgi:hypothetical protein